jgi:NhaP-type Na+/H+ or K+/H+ antiporter
MIGKVLPSLPLIASSRTDHSFPHRFTESIEESNFSSTIDLLANSAIFIYIGATMPFSAWNNTYTTLVPWRMVLLCLGILTLRRLPGMYALQWWIPDIKTRREALFAGHFGPMGVGAIFIVSQEERYLILLRPAH